MIINDPELVSYIATIRTTGLNSLIIKVPKDLNFQIGDVLQIYCKKLKGGENDRIR